MWLGPRQRPAASAAPPRSSGDVGRAEDALERTLKNLEELESLFREELEELESTLRIEEIEVETLSIPLRKSDCAVDGPSVVWCP